MPYYIAIKRNKKIYLGYFVCDMEADQYAIDTYNLEAKYSIIETSDPDHIKDQTELQNKEDESV